MIFSYLALTSVSGNFGFLIISLRAAGNASEEALDRLPTSATCMNLLKLPPYRRFVVIYFFCIKNLFFAPNSLNFIQIQLVLLVQITQKIIWSFAYFFLLDVILDLPALENFGLLHTCLSIFQGRIPMGTCKQSVDLSSTETKTTQTRNFSEN